MARTIHKLTDRGIKALKGDDAGRHSDGGGLYVLVKQNGNKSFVFMGKPKSTKARIEMGLGGIPTVSLSQARDKAAEYREIIAAGGDPRNAKKEATKRLASSFGDLAREYIATHQADWRNPKHLAQWEYTLLGPSQAGRGQDYCKSIRATPVEKITAQDVLSILEPIWRDKPETAKRIRSRIESVLWLATSKGLRAGDNPATLKLLQPVLGKQSQHHVKSHASMSYGELPSFWQELSQRPAMTARALEFLILTASRTNEVLGAEWQEIDLERRQWTIPRERMKRGKAHAVPLSEAAMAVLESLLHDGKPLGQFVFWGKNPNAKMSQMSMAMLLRRMDRNDITVHGFRSTFKTWCMEQTTFDSQLAEFALAHKTLDATEAAYGRSTLIDKRRHLMQHWADYALGKQSATVVQLHG